jgi:hypothetical protein
MKEHRGKSMDEALQRSLAGPQPAATALGKLPSDEAAQVGASLVDIAKAVAGAAKTVNPEEQAAIDKIAALFTPTAARLNRSDLNRQREPGSTSVRQEPSLR